MTKRLLNQKSEELLYVGIKNPVELRRDVLLSSKDALDMQRKIEIMRGLRKQKEETQNDLHHLFEHLIVLNKKIRAAMPKASIPEVPVMPVEVPVPETSEEQQPAPKEKTKLQVLEEELSAIESKLAALE